MPAMASASSNTPSTLSRYRPAILALTLLGAAASIYYIHGSFYSIEATPSQQPLRRRNALHRANGRRRGEEEEGQAQHNIDNRNASARVQASRRYLEACGSCMVETSRGGSFSTFLTPAVLQNTEEFRRAHGLSEADALQARHDLEEAFLDSYLEGYDEMIHEEIPIGRGTLWDELLGVGFLPGSLSAAIERFNGRLLDPTRNGSHPDGREWAQEQQEPNGDGNEEPTTNGLDGRETVVDVNSEFSWRGEHDNEAPKEGQSLLNLLYHIAEDQARREGYIHRGVTCNSCGSMPIRGIRYRCANCVDYDLCETCEAMQVHPKTHLFYKVRIPAPFLGNPRQAQPVWYPGKPSSLPQNLSREFAKRLVKDSGFENPEIEALWDQFRCLAATEWVEDPNKLNMAIDRRTFDRCFVPNTSIRPPPPNLIYDRMFAFYDTNGDGLIGFEEFLKGLASLNNKSKDERLKRVFQGYDIDGDGFVDRKDFLRMFRAFYALSKELTRDMVAGMEEDVTEGNAAKEIVLSSQPISSAFTGSIAMGERSRIGEGKRRDVNGDDEIIDNRPPLRESSDDTGDTNDVVADAAERAAFGNISSDSERKPWESMFSDGEVVEQVERELSPGFLRDRNRSSSDNWASAIADGEEEDLGGAANGSHWASNDEDWPPSYILAADVEAALGNGLSAQDVSEPQDREKVQTAARQRMEIEDRSNRDEVRRKAVQDRWRRREFYLDEEDGGVPPEGFEDIADDDQDKHEVRSDERSSPNHSHSPALRSRSSSKVRFRDDVTDVDYETRSNASMSSRNIPVGERWGGYEIPEAEKDVGKEVLYQVTQQGLNEMLDPLFKSKEDLAMEALVTKAERKRWRKEISQQVERSKGKHKKNGMHKSPLSPGQCQAEYDGPVPGYMGVVSSRGEAQKYIKQVQRQFKSQPGVYVHFLEIMIAYQTQILGTLDIIQRVCVLLADCPELIEGFNVFLQPGYQINAGRDDPPTVIRLHTNTSRGTMTFAIPRNEKSLNDFFRLPTTIPRKGPSSTPPVQVLEVVEALQNAVTTFDDTDAALEPAIFTKPLDELLEDSGYSVITPASEEDSLVPPPMSSDSTSQRSLPRSDSTSTEIPSQNSTNGQGSESVSKLESVNEVSRDRILEDTQLYDITNAPFPIVGQTISYTAEHLIRLPPQHRAALLRHLIQRHKYLSQTQTSNAPDRPLPDANNLQSTTLDSTPTRSSSAEDSTTTTVAAEAELDQLKMQIKWLLDINIVADRMEMTRRESASSSPSSARAPVLTPEKEKEMETKTEAGTWTETLDHDEPYPDPTLPQNRPSSIPSQPSATRTSTTLPLPPPLPSHIRTPPRTRLQHLAQLDDVERENTERGGPGRLNFEEFEAIMKGERGRKLGFVGAWIEMASF